MVELYVYLIVVFMFQESVTTSTAILRAREAGINWLTIHSIWLICTILGVLIPYYLGKLLLNNAFFKKKLQGLHNTTRRLLGRHGLALGLILLGLCNMTELNGLLAALLQLRIWYALPLFLTGTAIWYVSVLITNVISTDISHSANSVLYITVAFSLVITIVISIFYSRARGKNKVRRVKRG